MFTVSVVPALSPFLQTLEEAVGDKPKPHTAQSACKDNTSTSRRCELSQPQCPPAGGKLSWLWAQVSAQAFLCKWRIWRFPPAPPKKSVSFLNASTLTTLEPSTPKHVGYYTHQQPYTTRWVTCLEQNSQELGSYILMLRLKQPANHLPLQLDAMVPFWWPEIVAPQG